MMPPPPKRQRTEESPKHQTGTVGGSLTENATATPSSLLGADHSMRSSLEIEWHR